METETNLERAVMRRVTRAYYLKRVGSVPVALFLCGLAVYGVGKEVWVERVLANAPHSALGATRFFIDAFLNTETFVQVLTVAAVFSAVWFFRELARATAPMLSLRVR